jgi:2-oxoglutarate dehydrogenase E2 component (dihydrolipoamide succinyltransferase)
MTRLRLRVAERLKGAQNTYAMLTTFNEVDMSSLMQMRSQYKVTIDDALGTQGGSVLALATQLLITHSPVPPPPSLLSAGRIL